MCLLLPHQRRIHKLRPCWMSFARHLQSVNMIFLFLLKGVTHALSFSYRKNKHVLRLSFWA